MRNREHPATVLRGFHEGTHSFPLNLTRLGANVTPISLMGKLGHRVGQACASQNISAEGTF